MFSKCVELKSLEKSMIGLNMVVRSVAERQAFLRQSSSPQLKLGLRYLRRITGVTQHVKFWLLSTLLDKMRESRALVYILAGICQDISGLDCEWSQRRASNIQPYELWSKLVHHPRPRNSGPWRGTSLPLSIPYRRWTMLDLDMSRVLVVWAKNTNVG